MQLFDEFLSFSSWILQIGTYSWVPNNRVYTETKNKNFPRCTVLLGTYTIKGGEEILKFSSFLRGFLVCFVHYGYAKCEIMYHRLVLYLNMYYHLPFSCGTLLKSKNWFDVLNFRFSQLHDYSGYTIIRDSRVVKLF